jgi:hypothetical protein
MIGATVIKSLKTCRILLERGDQTKADVQSVDLKVLLWLSGGFGALRASSTFEGSR